VPPRPLGNLTAHPSATRALRLAACLLALLVGLAAVRVDAARAADDNEPTLTVRGQGVGRAAPDAATVIASVRRRARTAAAARAQADARTRTLLAAILATGVDRVDVQTSSIGLGREPTPEGGSRRGAYVASATVVVRTRRVDLVGAIIAASTRAGADGVDGPNYSLADPSSASVAATEAALADARRRAEAAAAALGRGLGDLRSVTVDPPFGAELDRAAPGTGQGSPSRPPPVEPGQAEVRVSVEVVFELD